LIIRTFLNAQYKNAINTKKKKNAGREWSLQKHGEFCLFGHFRNLLLCYDLYATNFVALPFCVMFGNLHNDCLSCHTAYQL